ncbi:MAG: F0F1 ATP synthase subunit epsilon [Defluviimonas sp.]|uniref:F0F1 ATP synthase subunit epsilon n=1 Tax=Albidovulum sp. TaxID=1872424 RepID=UPI001D7A723A|nr:F0F1 ATP synthase subunit epsilon [Paracoccaceae bacterium]MCC0064552.1 F0F1 ATP synthase subunit epsilon [Defluviimonas sp.]
MADTMQFDLVSPERKLVSAQAREVHIPGADGDLTAMPDHAPLITTLRPGILTVVTAEGATDYAVTGGFAEIGAEGVSVLAERAHVTHEVTQAMIDEMIAAAQKAHKEAHPDVVDSAAKLLSDLVAMGSRIGLEPKLS